MAVTCKARVPVLVAAIAFGGAICAVGPASGQEPIRIGEADARRCGTRCGHKEAEA